MVSTAAWPHCGHVVIETRVGATSAIALLSDCKPLGAVACIGNRSDLLLGIRGSGDADYPDAVVAGHAPHLGSQHFGLSSAVIPTRPGMELTTAVRSSGMP